jgi:hypothetical protein
MTRMTRTTTIVLVALTGTAAAEPRLPKPSEVREPPPKNLRMRPRVAQTAPAPAAPTSPMPQAPPPMSRAPAPATRDDEATVALRDINQRVSFSIDVGYQVESAQPTGRASLDRPAPVEGTQFDAFRAYGFGEVFAATRGVGLQSLSSYFALRFQAARKSLTTTENMPTTVDVTPPIATWFQRSGVEARSGWGEMRDFLPQRWGLQKLRVRGGSQYVYGPWVMHLDGFLVAYEGAILKASGYSGLRHSDYTREQPDRRPSVSGLSLRADLRGLPRPLPLAVQADLLAVGSYAEAGQPASRSGLLQGDWRPRRDVAMIASVRTLDGNVASQRLELRARYKEVTNVVLDVNRHTRFDWRWDPALVAPDRSDNTAARRYLDLGPVVPRFVGSLRAGTLIAENIDLFLRGAFAANVTGDEADEKNTFAAPYYEVGGALEVRLRRAVALGASALTRDTSREQLEMPIFDAPSSTQPIPASEYRGEEGFTEVGATIKLSLGARTFSSQLELYGRRTRYAILYEDPALEIPSSDIRYGGRITLDAWVGRQLRLFASYDLSSAFDFQPEINGYKTLRLMITGVY